MSLRLPSDLIRATLQFLPKLQVSQFCRKNSVCNNYFWLNYFAMCLNTSPEVLQQEVEAIKFHNPIQLAGYYNIILAPAADRYFSPIQCYLSYINADKNDVAAANERKYYLSLITPVPECEDLLLRLVARASVKNPGLVRDYFAIFDTFRSGYTVDSYYLFVSTSEEERKWIRYKLFGINDVNYNDYDLGQNLEIIAGRSFRFLNERSDRDSFRLAAEYQPDSEAWDEASIPHQHSIHLRIIEGNLLAGNIDKAIHRLKTKVTADRVNQLFPHVFYLVDSLEFYLALEEKILSFNPHANLREFRLNMLCIIPSLMFVNENESIANRTFNYILNNLNVTQYYQELTTLLKFKSILDFHGFILIWNILPKNIQQQVDWKLMQCAEAKNVILD